MKVLKILGIATLVFMAIIVLIIALIWGSIEWNRYSKKKEAIRYQKEVCDTIRTVVGNFELKVDGFMPKELKTIKFYLKRDQLIIRDTTINFTAENDLETQMLTIPFKIWDVKDWIIVVIKDRTYLLSGFSYIAYYNYGMFGPVGPCQCGGSSYQNVNGKPAGSGWLLKKEGLLNYQLPPRK
ncbi:hypothetical protein [Pedobacter sp. SL55]|uniref:hypothetical protein n=1 Tax=Pedobacter sp. SL55 TaxID=2995161 RepID=UPI00227118CD|nr:hypothetical protein [Pedobacter sp. SL55]WAC42577.1 hypothetical protein OVA16_09545 [Pedobacter sp. SL55]